MNEQSNKDQDKETKIEILSEQKEQQEFDLKNIFSKAFNVLDNYYQEEEKKQKTKKIDQITEKAKKTEKVSKKDVKISDQETEIDLKETAEEYYEEYIDISKIKEQYFIFVNLIFGFLNPILTKAGIEAINLQEQTELFDAILETLSGTVKKRVKSIGKSFNVLRNLRKYLNLIRVIWSILAPRMTLIKTRLQEFSKKQEIKQTHQYPENKIG